MSPVDRQATYTTPDSIKMCVSHLIYIHEQQPSPDTQLDWESLICPSTCDTGSRLVE